MRSNKRYIFIPPPHLCLHKEVIPMGCMCHKCSGVMKLVTGALLLLNAFVWPQWLGVDGWVRFVAVLMVLGGFVKLVVPNKCPNCAAACGSMTAASAKGKKK